MQTRKLTAALALTLGLSFSAGAGAQDLDKLPDYVPVLPQVKARALPVDPQKSYLVQEVKPNVYVITDGVYQSAFVTTGKGVILFDAPPSFAEHIAKAVADVTAEPIVQLVYSHVHLDHISGAHIIVKQIPKLQIVAEEGTAEFLREMHDPRRPVPTRIFKDHRTLKLGSMTVELKVGHWHSPEGDLFIYLPGKKFLMAIDTLAPGSVPFMGFDLTMNMHDYLKVFDQLQVYDFDVLVSGHLTYLAGREDVQVTKDYVMDVYKTIKRIHDGADQMTLAAPATQKYGWDNKFADAWLTNAPRRSRAVGSTSWRAWTCTPPAIAAPRWFTRAGTIDRRSAHHRKKQWEVSQAHMSELARRFQ